MVLERSIYSDFVFLEAMYRQGFIRKQCESAAGWPCGHGGGFVKVLLDPPCSWHMFCKRLLLISRRMMPFLRESQSLPTPPGARPRPLQPLGGRGDRAGAPHHC